MKCTNKNNINRDGYEYKERRKWNMLRVLAECDCQREGTSRLHGSTKSCWHSLRMKLLPGNKLDGCRPVFCWLTNCRGFGFHACLPHLWGWFILVTLTLQITELLQQLLQCSFLHIFSLSVCLSLRLPSSLPLSAGFIQDCKNKFPDQNMVFQTNE